MARKGHFNRGKEIAIGRWKRTKQAGCGSVANASSSFKQKKRTWTQIVSRFNLGSVDKIDTIYKCGYQAAIEKSPKRKTRAEALDYLRGLKKMPYAFSLLDLNLHSD